MNKKAFTLVELIGVIVIVSLVLMIVFPALNKLIHGNNVKKYENYYSMIESGAKLYAASKKDELGNSTQNGCTEFTLEDLINNDHLKEYNDKSTTCSLSSNKIRVKNTRGKINVYFKITCDDKTPSTPAVILGEEDVTNCIAYTKSETTTLYDSFRNLSGATFDNVGSTSYLTNNASNNHVYYSGQVWKMYAYNSMEETIKAASRDPLTTIPFSTVNSNNYGTSTVQRWLSTEVMANLKDHDKYLVMTEYDATRPANATSPPVSDPTKITRTKIALPTYFDVYKSRYAIYDANQRMWLQTEGPTATTVQIYSTSASLDTTLEANTFATVKASVTFAPELKVIRGDGSFNNPFIIQEDFMGKADDSLNTRSVGEYIYLVIGGNNQRYRINKINDEGSVRIVSHDSYDNLKFDDSFYDYSYSALKNSLENNIYNNLSSLNKNLVIEGTFCSEIINQAVLASDSAPFNSTCMDKTKERSHKIGLLKLGELFATGSANYRMWTMNPNAISDSDYSSTINIFANLGQVEAASISESNRAHAVMTLSPQTKIVSGEGTFASPYRIR